MTSADHVQRAKQKEIIREFDAATGDRNYQKRKGFMDKIKDLFG